VTKEQIEIHEKEDVYVVYTVTHENMPNLNGSSKHAIKTHRVSN